MRIPRFTKLVLDFMFWCAVGVTICVPAIFRIAGRNYPNIKNNYEVMCVLFSASGIMSALILRELRHIFKTVLDNDCFVMTNVDSLRRMASCAFGIAILSAVRLIFVITPATFVIIIVFFIAGLFSITLSQVFEKAVTYKQENDFTI